MRRFPLGNDKKLLLDFLARIVCSVLPSGEVCQAPLGYNTVKSIVFKHFSQIQH